jgi:hypothetical protein
MPSITDSAGNRTEYTTLVAHDDSICLDGSTFIIAKLADFTVDDGSPLTRTPDEFRNLFTPAEERAAKKLATDNPDTDLAVWWSRLFDSSSLRTVDLSLPSVQGALANLVELEVLTEDRMAAILTGKPI